MTSGWCVFVPDYRFHPKNKVWKLVLIELSVRPAVCGMSYFACFAVFYLLRNSLSLTVLRCVYGFCMVIVVTAEGLHSWHDEYHLSIIIIIY